MLPVASVPSYVTNGVVESTMHVNDTLCSLKHSVVNSCGEDINDAVRRHLFDDCGMQLVARRRPRRNTIARSGSSGPTIDGKTISISHSSASSESTLAKFCTGNRFAALSEDDQSRPIFHGFQSWNAFCLVTRLAQLVTPSCLPVAIPVQMLGFVAQRRPAVPFVSHVLSATRA